LTGAGSGFLTSGAFFAGDFSFFA
jgi:hypothetical protein